MSEELPMSDESTESGTRQRVKPDLEDGKERAKEAAREVAIEGKERLEAQSEAAATRVDDVADAIGSAASRLDELDHQGLAEYANQMASALGDLSAKLREKSVDELAHDVSSIAKRNPAMFLLGSVAVGLGLSRFAKAKRPRQDTSEPVKNSEHTDDQWQRFENGEFVPDAARERTSVETRMAPDGTGGSGL